MKKKLAVLVSVICILFIACGCGISNNINVFANQDDPQIKETLLSNFPVMDKNQYNRFLFKGQITAANAEELTASVSIDGAVEMYKDISHLFGMTVMPSDSDSINVESWADFSSGIRYDSTNKSDFDRTGITDRTAIDMLVYVINNRPESPDLIISDEACTMSWVFDTDVNALFGGLVSKVAANTTLSGNGRLTAVFDPSTYELQYFNVVVSANNEDRTGALLDMVFHWDIKNSETEALAIPAGISNGAYLASTGVETNGGYDPVINKMAEDFIASYNGYASVSNYDNGSCMFWTLSTGDISATVNYERSGQADLRYEKSREFFETQYGQPVETTGNGAYFFNEETDELTYLAVKDDLYAEIIITGDGKTQGELRRPLITYKSKLDM